MIQKSIALLALTTLSFGCAASSNSPVTGFAYTAAKGATNATSNEIGSKTGTSCATSYVGVVALGDASIAAAAKAGGITKISTVDSDNTGIVGVYAKNCTVVTGN
jgi:hypothetical protein